MAPKQTVFERIHIQSCSCVPVFRKAWIHCIALLAARGKMQKKAVIFFSEWHTPPSLLYSNISYFLNYAMLDRKNGLSRKDSCTYTFFLYFQCWIKNRNIRATKSFCPGMRHSFFPSFPTSQLPPESSRCWIENMDTWTFLMCHPPSHLCKLPVVCIYNVGSNILDSGARKVVSRRTLSKFP